MKPMSNLASQTTKSPVAQGFRTIVDRPGLLWLDLDDPMSPALDDLAVRYGFHELTVEDCRHQVQLAKIDYYEDYSFLIINTTQYTENPCQVTTREINAYLGLDFIFTIHFGKSYSVEDVERRLTPANHRLARPDQIFHAIIDLVVDRYLPTLDSMGDTIDRIQDELLVDPKPSHLETMFDLKRGLLHFRRAVSSQRELLNVILRDDSPMVRDDLRAYFRDVYDHAVRAMDLVESYRDLLTGGLDIYLTQMANRTNEIVKGLTILATIMLPLTLITGYFGMNFNHPFLTSRNGLIYSTIALIAITVLMLIYFKYRKWI